VYAALAQAPPGTFAGGVSLGFCADQDFRHSPLCPGAGLRYTANKHGDFVFEAAAHLQEPWIALQGQQDVVCDPKAVDEFVARIPSAKVVPLPKVGHGFSVERNWLPELQQSFAIIKPGTTPDAATAIDVAGLPLVEVLESRGQSATEHRLALIISGDGGWAGLDRDVAKHLAAQGIPVVGLDSLRYFWQARTPDQTAADVSRTLEHFLSVWHKERIELVGYSFGADVLPFVVTRLSAALRAKIESVTLISPSSAASFEFHVSNWLPGASPTGTALAPEVLRLTHPPLCLYGKGDSDTICASMSGKDVVATQIGSGHHLGGDGAGIVERILQFAKTGT
jgi:pimeloyl-ACP methyl ester carboxylesterase